MKLTVEIIRHGKNSAKTPGTLEAYVHQGGIHGPNLLKRRVFRHLEDAKYEITNISLKGHEVTFIDPPPEDQVLPPMKSAKEQYGMKGILGRQRG